jgi:hypothetical protein
MKARLTANEQAFAGFITRQSGKTYQFNGSIGGNGMFVSPGLCVAKAKYVDNRAPKFKLEPNGGNVFVPAVLPDIEVGTLAGYTVQTCINVFNIGTAPGCPVFTLRLRAGTGL